TFPSDMMFFILFLRLPPFTFFPYTTLFRSGRESRSSRVSTSEMVAGRGAGAGCMGRRLAAGALAAAVRLIRIRDIASRIRDSTKDRKSTRLNSSHVKISYAVFCLKKKTILK